jgi:uncharacterized protein YceK
MNYTKYLSSLIVLFSVTALTAVSGCSSMTVRRIEIPGYNQKKFGVEKKEAETIDKLVENEPSGSDKERCAYWKKEILALPETPSNLLDYAEYRGGGWCEKSGETIEY